MWLRWTLPRIRLDQMMYLCLKVLLPFSMATLILSTFWQALLPAHGRITGVAVLAAVVLGGGLYVSRVLRATPSFRKVRQS
jgi:hypothetical protein